MNVYEFLQIAEQHKVRDLVEKDLLIEILEATPSKFPIHKSSDLRSILWKGSKPFSILEPIP